MERLAGVECFESFEIIPGEPSGESLSDGVSVLLEAHQVMERIDAVQLAGVDYA